MPRTSAFTPSASRSFAGVAGAPPSPVSAARPLLSSRVCHQSSRMPPRRLARSPARAKRLPSPEPAAAAATAAAGHAAATSSSSEDAMLGILSRLEDEIDMHEIEGSPPGAAAPHARNTTRRRGASSPSLQPFLSELRRRVRAEVALLRQRRGGGGGRGRAAAAAQRVGQRVRVVRDKTQVVREQLKRRIRRKITGAEDHSVRDYVRSVLEEPPVVRLRDKLSFLLGVVGCLVVEAVALQRPEQFWICYTICMLPLLALRVHLFTAISQQYFLLDFCYASNAACLVQLYVYPSSTRLFQANFLLTTGPLAMAVPTWRNSLVFHSLDRVTSSYIHVLPPLLSFCMRWFPPSGLHVPSTLPFAEGMLGSLVFYAGWQACYLLYTEWLHPPAPLLDTSIRVLASGKKDVPPPACYTGITKLTFHGMAALGVMARAERFDAEQWKTKVIFVSVQLAYTAATLLLAAGLYASFRAHLAYLLAIFACCIWNGGSYYIEVFSKAYRKQFEGDAVTRRRLQLELLVNGNLPDGPPAPAEEEEEKHLHYEEDEGGGDGEASAGDLTIKKDG